MTKWLAQLRQRNVFKVATAYLVAGWALIQLGSELFGSFDAPDWVPKVFTVIIFLGFPVACLFAWALEVTPEGIRITQAGDPETQAEARHSDWLWGGVIGLTLLLAAANFVYQWNHDGALSDDLLSGGQEQTNTSAQAAVESASIAVLPFVDMSETGDQQYFGDGIAEELLNGLTRVKGLKVAARTSAFGFKNMGASMEEIGAALHVNHVLEGSVRRSGDHVRITAQLIDVHSGYHLFSETYDRKLKDVFAIQDDIAREIVGALLPSLGVQLESPLITPQTDSEEAHDLRMQARHAFFSATPGSLKAAIEMLQQAVTIDPHYSDAWGDLSYAFSYLGNQAGDPLVSLTQALEAANRALALDPDNSPALLARAWWLGVFQYDHEQAAQLYQRLREGGGSLSLWAINIAWGHLFPLGRYQEALQYVREARALDPLIRPVLAQTEMFALLELGRLPEALQVANEVYLSAAPPPSAALVASIVFSRAGELENAAKMLEYGLSRMGVAPVSIMAQASLNTARGDGEANRQLLGSLLTRRAQGEWVFPVSVAFIYLELGEQEKAIDWFERALDMHDPMMVVNGVMYMRDTPGFRDNPRVKVMFQRMNLPLTDDAAVSQAVSGDSAVMEH